MKRLVAAMVLAASVATGASATDKVLVVCDPWPPFQEGQENADVLMEATWEIDALPFFIAASRRSERGMALIASLDEAMRK